MTPESPETDTVPQNFFMDLSMHPPSRPLLTLASVFQNTIQIPHSSPIAKDKSYDRKQEDKSLPGLPLVYPWPVPLYSLFVSLRSSEH